MFSCLQLLKLHGYREHITYSYVSFNSLPLCWIVNFNIKLTWETRYKKNQNYLSPTFHCKCTIYNPRWGEMVHLTQCKESIWKWSFFFFLSFVSGVGSFTIVDGNKIKGEDVGNKWAHTYTTYKLNCFMFNCLLYFILFPLMFWISFLLL